jgi:hypothetical protein
MAATTIPNLDNIEREHRNIKRKILRCASSGDIRRLLGIRAELVRIRQDLEKMKQDCTTPKPAFRRSYALEAFMEGLSAGKKPKDLQSSRCRPSDVGLPDLCCLG